MALAAPGGADGRDADHIRGEGESALRGGARGRRGRPTRMGARGFSGSTSSHRTASFFFCGIRPSSSGLTPRADPTRRPVDGEPCLHPLCGFGSESEGLDNCGQRVMGKASVTPWSRGERLAGVATSLATLERDAGLRFDGKAVVLKPRGQCGLANGLLRVGFDVIERALDGCPTQGLSDRFTKPQRNRVRRPRS